MANSTLYRFMPADDFTGPGTTFDKNYPAFGLTVYKQYESQRQCNAKISEHLQSLVELCAGAHYYARGPHGGAYEKARAVANLQNVQLNTSGRRVGCISLSVAGDYGAVDMGLENEGDGAGWFTHRYGHGSVACTYSGDKVFVPDSVSSVTIETKAVREDGLDVVKADFIWSGKVMGHFACSFPANKLFKLDSAGRPMVRYCRFMSLIPQDRFDRTPDVDYNDGSYMKNAQFTNLELLNRSTNTWEPWDTGKLDYIWSVQGWNISQCSIGSTSNGMVVDSFSLAHTHNVYAK